MRNPGILELKKSVIIRIISEFATGLLVPQSQNPQARRMVEVAMEGENAKKRSP